MSNNLAYKKYQATFHFNEKDELFHGRITGIDNLVSFEGTTVERLTEAFHKAVEEYLPTAKKLNNRRVLRKLE